MTLACSCFMDDIRTLTISNIWSYHQEILSQCFQLHLFHFWPRHNSRCSQHERTLAYMPKNTESEINNVNCYCNKNFIKLFFIHLTWADMLIGVTTAMKTEVYNLCIPCWHSAKFVHFCRDGYWGRTNSNFAFKEKQPLALRVKDLLSSSYLNLSSKSRCN
jgi:hypothetical protein